MRALHRTAAALALNLSAAAWAQTPPPPPPLPPPRPHEFSVPQTIRDANGEPQACAMARAAGAVLADLVVSPSGASLGEACGVEEGAVLTGVRLPGGGLVALQTSVVVRCALAGALATWVRNDVAPSMQKRGFTLNGLHGVGGYECRRRNRGVNGKISQHALGGAFDLRALGAEGGRVVSLMTADAATVDLRNELKVSACANFTTVLGAGSDSFHEDHLHVDNAQRRGGFRLCQWNVK